MAAEQQNIVKTVLKLRAEVHHVLVSRGKDEAAEDSGTNKHDVELAAKFISSLGVAAHGLVAEPRQQRNGADPGGSGRLTSA